MKHHKYHTKYVPYVSCDNICRHVTLRYVATSVCLMREGEMDMLGRVRTVTQSMAVT